MISVDTARSSLHVQQNQSSKLNHFPRLRRVPRWALSPASHRYVPTSFRSGCHVVLSWLAECTIMSLNPAFKTMLFSSFDCSWYSLRRQRTYTIVYFERFVRNQPVFRSVACCFSLWGKHGGQSLRFSRGISLATFWLAEDTRVSGS